MHWSIKDNCTELAVKKFLSTGAPMPDNCELVARYHAPGSCQGWLIARTDDIATIYEHASEWGELLNWDTHPVVNDDIAGVTCNKVWN